MTNTDQKNFRTSDLYFAAYLQVSGAPFDGTIRETSKRVSFVFKTDLVNIDELREAWFNKTGRVPAIDYANAIKNLKSVCHMV